MAQPPKIPENLALRDFSGINTQSPRQTIEDNQFSWLSEWMPIAHGNMKLLPGPSSAVANIAVGGYEIFYMMSASIGLVNYLFCFLTDGSAWQVDTDNGTVTKFASAGKFTVNGVRACQWKNERILIADTGNGYFDWDTKTLTSYKNTIYNVDIISAGGNFTTAPSIYASGGGGSGATFLATIGAGKVNSELGGGTNYQVGDILSVDIGSGLYSNGTNKYTTVSDVATIRVTAVGASNAVTGAVIETPGSYETAPANPVSVTGGYGSGAQFDLGWLLESVSVTNPGSGYTSIPTLLVNPSDVVGSPVYITKAGSYTGTAPTSPVSVTGGTGVGFTANPTFGLTGVTSSYSILNGPVWISWFNAGYHIGDILTCVGGTSTTAAQVVITNIVYFLLYDPSFTVTEYAYAYYFDIYEHGNYSVWPASRQFTTTGGHGSGLEVGQTLSSIGLSPPKYEYSYATMGIWSATIATVDDGTHHYTNGDVLTVSGGTPITAAQFTYNASSETGGAILSANLNISISGSSIASYSGRVWMVTSQRTVVFSAPDSYQDFLTADGAGSFILSDEQMRSEITALKAANDYLYIAGRTSMFILSGVNLTTNSLGSPVTTFSLNNLTTSFGTDIPDAILPYVRSMMFGSDYGWYAITGATPQKISDALDGLLLNADLSTVTSGSCIIYGHLCNCWLVNYTDPTIGVAVATILIFVNGKWFVSVQNPSLKLIAGSVYNDIPVLYGTDGANIYRLFSESTTQRTFEIDTKQWDMGNPLITKKITRIGFEGTFQNTSTINLDTQTEATTATNSVTPATAGYYLLRINASAVGNYVGLNISGSCTPGDIISGIYMDYIPQTPWSDAKGGP